MQLDSRLDVEKGDQFSFQNINCIFDAHADLAVNKWPFASGENDEESDTVWPNFALIWSKQRKIRKNRKVTLARKMQIYSKTKMLSTVSVRVIFLIQYVYVMNAHWNWPEKSIDEHIQANCFG